MSWFIPLFIFLTVAIFTPGPNNILAMGIGFSWGFKKVIPHIFGVAIGFPVMLLLIGFVLKPLLQHYPYIFDILKYASFLYILYLAYKIATAPLNIKEQEVKKPITFLESMAFQWINPKSWAGALATITLYLPKNNFSIALIISSTTSALMIIFAIALWGYLGKRIKDFLTKENHIKIFNYVMSLLLVVSVFMMLI